MNSPYSITRFLRCAAILIASALIFVPSRSQCQKATDSAAIRVARRDSARIAIVENAVPGALPRAALIVDTVPVLRIGSGGTSPQIRELADARVLASGGIVLADRVSASLHFYSRYGAYVKSAGGSSDTTTRFVSLRSTEVRGDTVIACCAPGIALFTATGTFIRSTPEFRGGFLGVLPNGRFLIRRTTDETRAYQGQKGVVKTLLLDTLFSLDRAGAPSGRLAVLPSRVHVGVYNPDPNPLGLSITLLETPFEPESYYAKTAAGFLYADSRRIEVRHYSSAGALQRIIRLQSAATPVTRELLDRFKQAVLRKYTRDDTRRYIEWVLGQYVAPEYLPQVRAVRAGAGGQIWLREHTFPEASSTRWHAFAATGEYLGHVLLPARWTVHQFGADFVLASQAANNGDRSAAVYRMSPTASPGHDSLSTSRHSPRP